MSSWAPIGAPRAIQTTTRAQGSAIDTREWVLEDLNRDVVISSQSGQPERVRHEVGSTIAMAECDNLTLRVYSVY